MAAPAGKFKLNRKTVRELARGFGPGGPALKAAVHGAAEETLAKAGPNATIDDYRTDRVVSGIVVPADEQARDGVATRAAQQTSAEHKTRPFVSRAQWRRGYLVDEAEAHKRAKVSARYSSLPERFRRAG